MPGTVPLAALRLREPAHNLTYASYMPTLSSPGGFVPELPPFSSEGLLPPGDYQLTLDELERSHLVVGTPGEPWAAKTREQLVRNLRILVD